MNQTIKLALALVLGTGFAAGCSHSPEAQEAPTTTTSAALDATGVIVRGGDFRFVFDESTGVATQVRSGCAKQPDVEACVARIREAGSLEGWRFVPIDDTHARLDSYGLEEGPEELFMTVPVAIERVDERTVKLTPTEAPKGTRLPKQEQKTVLIEVRDADSFAVRTPQGPMVYRRKP